MNSISVIVPCFNEESVIEETNKRLVSVLSQIQDFTYEIIYVNDGSKDNTLSIIKTLASQNHCVKVLSFSRNFGHQSAVTAGLENASGDCTVIIDADLQDPPEVIVQMIDLWKNGYEVVYAVRKERKGETFFKLITAKAFYRTLRYLSDVQIPLDTGDFRLMDKKVVIALNSLKEKNRFIRGLVAWLGFKQIGLEYEREARYSGSTKYTFKKMIRFAIDGLLSFSHKPLRIALNLGFISTFLAFSVLGYVLVASYLEPSSVIRGWTSLFVGILFLGGVQLICIGILGEYLARIYDEVKNRPTYIVSEKVNLNKHE